MSRSKLARVVSALVVVMALGGALGPHDLRGGAAAQRVEPTTGPERWTGSFVLAEPRSAAEARVHDAIESTVSGMFFVIRGVARGRLRETNDVPERVDIETSGRHVVVRYDGEAYEGDE